MEDNFSTDGGGRGGMVQAVMWAAMGSGRCSFACLLACPAAHLLMCGPGPNRPGPDRSAARGWGPLIYKTLCDLALQLPLWPSSPCSLSSSHTDLLSPGGSFGIPGMLTPQGCSSCCSCCCFCLDCSFPQFIKAFIQKSPFLWGFFLLKYSIPPSPEHLTSMSLI